MTDDFTSPEPSDSDESGDIDSALVDVQLPDREAYPAPSGRDFVCAIRRARDTESSTRHVCGRYTSFRTWVDESPVGQPDEPTEVIRVQACERDSICTIPVASVDEILTALTSGAQNLDGGEGD